MEPFLEQRPWEVQHIDPSRRFASLGVSPPRSELRAAIWEIATGKLVWGPKGAEAICWSHSGSEVFVAGEIRPYYQGFLRRYSWPGLELTADGGVEMAGYAFHGLAASSKGMVAVSSIDQTETYVYLYDSDEAAGWPKLTAKWEDRGSNLINGLEFSPDGSRLVWTLGAPYYWWTGGDEPRLSKGGRFEIGKIFAWKTDRRVPGEVMRANVVVSVPAGWSADDPEDILSSQMLQGPFFDSEGNFRMLLPTGDWKAYTPELRDLPDPEGGRKAVVREFATLNLRRASKADRS